MINRILIRIKVVQMLYSYLLVEKDFSIESQLSAPTKEKRFAHALYMDLLALMTQMSGSITRRGYGTPLANSRFIKEVMADDRMRSLLAKYRIEGYPFNDIRAGLEEKIKESAILKNFVTDGDNSSNADVTVWKNIFEYIMVGDNALASAIERRENYTLHGVERAKELMETTFKNFYSSRGDSISALNTLRKSLDAARELYFRMLWLPVEITRLRERQIDDARHKYLPTKEDLNPNLRFVENQLVAAIAENPEVAEYTEKHKISWNQENPFLISSLLKSIMESEAYQQYMNAPASNYRADGELWRNLFKQVILNNDIFLSELEDKSVFWNDDIEIIGTFALKTLKRMEDFICSTSENEMNENPILPMFKDEEDAAFGSELLNYVLREKESYRDLIDEFIDKRTWDMDRIAFMDIVILLTAIAEVMHFPKIPAQVTVNEYIEMARSYSTPKSAQFIHGMLGAIITRLNEQGVIHKL